MRNALRHLVALWLLCCACGIHAGPPVAPAAPLRYDIVDLGSLTGESLSEARNVTAGGLVVGDMAVSGVYTPLAWNRRRGLVELPNGSRLRSSSIAMAANDAGLIVGFVGIPSGLLSMRPVKWVKGKDRKIPIPRRYASGTATDVNAHGVVIGYVSDAEGAHAFVHVHERGETRILQAETPDGKVFAHAFAVNDSGLVVGDARLPSDPLGRYSVLYDLRAGTMIELGSLPGSVEGAAYDVSAAGHVVGAATFPLYDLPWIWTAADGMVAIPLPAGCDSGGAGSVNRSGQAVGVAYASAAPKACLFFYDGASTHRLQDLVDPGSGWHFSAIQARVDGISDDGVIVGSAYHGDRRRAFAMLPRRR